MKKEDLLEQTLRSVRVSQNHVFFWGSCFSNWAPSEFGINDEKGKTLKFYNSEQYFMYKKAIAFGDEETALRILKEGKNPRTAKSLGRMVKNYDDAKWNELRFDVMKEACLLKFSQNEDLKAMLLLDKFKDKGFVEGSPEDRIWGIGIHWEEASDDETTWKGQNLLGKSLDYVRETLLK